MGGQLGFEAAQHQKPPLGPGLPELACGILERVFSRSAAAAKGRSHCGAKHRASRQSRTDFLLGPGSQSVLCVGRPGQASDKLLLGVRRVFLHDISRYVGGDISILPKQYLSISTS